MEALRRKFKEFRPWIELAKERLALARIQTKIVSGGAQTVCFAGENSAHEFPPCFLK
jgi:hypothetical protein